MILPEGIIFDVEGIMAQRAIAYLLGEGGVG
jgi:hypothetical protein